MITVDLNPFFTTFWKNLLHILMDNSSGMICGLNRKHGHFDIMFSRVEAQVGDQLIMLISIALLFMIVGEPVECV